MAMIEYDEYKQKLTAMGPELDKLAAALDMDRARAELKDLQAQTEQEGFWNDLATSQKVSQQIKRLENKVHAFDKLRQDWEDATVLCEMGQEADDPELLPELEESYATLEKEVEERRLATLLSGEYDANNAILTLHAGAGGTEAQDWALHALPHVYPLGRAPRLHLSDPGL